MSKNILYQELLSKHTTLKLGGPARFMFSIENPSHLVECYRFAEEKKLPVHILGGGSNTIFADSGYNGVIATMKMTGTDVDARTDSHVIVRTKAGHNWDLFVKQCIQNGMSGIECLSGIPGTVGAAPIQNIGAYGQEVKDTIISVEVLERKDLIRGILKPITLNSGQLGFAYRNSRFKSEDANRYVILSVVFCLSKETVQEPTYRELKESLGEDYKDLSSTDKLIRIREKVLELRRKKSMVLDPEDPDSVSAGSFFLNPVLSDHKYKEFQKKITKQPPVFQTEDGIKTSAAWLIEYCGFQKGEQLFEGIYISRSHSLALVNRQGSTEALLKSANKIVEKVYQETGIRLVQEPVYVE